MKTILILFTCMVLSNLCAAQAPMSTDTTRGFASADNAILEMYYNAFKEPITARFSNGSQVNLTEVLQLDSKRATLTQDQLLLLCIGYMNQKGFHVGSSFTVGDYHTKHLFERR